MIPLPDDNEIRKTYHVTGASTSEARSMACPEISFPSGGETIAATWYRPNVSAAPVPCVVMGHGFTLTRRDGVPEYARRLAAAGFAALAFDYRHWGDSTGSPRGWISLSEQLADWQAAVQHARTLQGVDAERIAVWGFSMGGGHALLTAARDTRIAAAVALMPSTDPLAAPPPLTVGLRMIGRALREAITRRAVTMPAAGPPGSFAVIAAPEALPGFERLTSRRDWSNEVNTSWLLTGRHWRPVREVAKIRADVLLQLGERDGAVPVAAIADSHARSTCRAQAIRPRPLRVLRPRARRQARRRPSRFPPASLARPHQHGETAVRPGPPSRPASYARTWQSRAASTSDWPRRAPCSVGVAGISPSANRAPQRSPRGRPMPLADSLIRGNVQMHRLVARVAQRLGDGHLVAGPDDQQPSTAHVDGLLHP